MQEMGIILTMNEIEETTKEEWKKVVNKAIWYKEHQEYFEWSQNSIKCNLMMWDRIKMKQYVTELEYEAAKIIMEVRLGMIDVKVNYKNKYQDTICRNCGIETETAEHYINCRTEKQDKKAMENWHEIWTMSSIKNMNKVAHHALKVLKSSPHITYV